ncbi:MFS transporter [Pseudonocardia acaciae]|uniref:MFS transporter n=1 Tax=Pseudonocardia acaciae TaxID=551276 RepID=UPI0007E8C762|nr:MFS transporter [Pseudonocardia acaciae]
MPETQIRWKTPAAILAVGTFAVGTDAFVIAGVLPSIASSLGVGLAAAGQLVTVFSLAYALTAPVLGMLTAGWSRRTALVVALAAFTVGNVLTALAPDYGLVLASRVLAAAGAALFTATASATAAGLAGPTHRGRAIAIVMFGITSSLVLGAPLGTAIGGLADWRATLWFVTVLGLVAAVLLRLRLPRLAPTRATAEGTDADATALRQRLAPLADRRVLGLLTRTLVVFTGIYLPYTYLSAVYQPATGDDGNKLALALLLFGVAGTAGNLAAGALADRFDPRRVIVVGTLAPTVALLAVPALRGSMATAVVAVLVTGVLSFTVTTPQQQQLVAMSPGAQSVVTSLYQSVLYLAVSLSGVLGGLGLNLVGAAALAPVAAGFVLLASVLSWASGRERVAKADLQGRRAA